VRLAWGVLAAAAGLWAMTRRSPSGHRPPEPRYPGDQQAGATARGGNEHDGNQPQRAAAQKGPAKPPETSDERHQRRECWYWIITGLMSVLATGAAGFAAWYAYGAYDTARQALVATTRAYIVLRAEITTDEESKRPVFRFAAENMGATPVRNLFFWIWSERLDNPWARPEINERIDCARSAGPSRTGLTFGKEAKYDLPAGAEPGAVERTRTILIHGQACYRDVFGTAHALPVCFLWHPGGGAGGEQCRYGDH